MKTVGLIDVVIIVIYFAVILGVGIFAGRKVKSSTDFALAGGNLRFPMLLGTLIATAVGAASTIGRAGKAYEVGILIALSGVAYGLGMLAFSFFAPILKRTGYWSVPAALAARFGKQFRLISAFLIIAGLIGVFASQLIALGLTANLMMADLGITYTQAVVASAAVMTFYTLFGGMKSVAAADMFQVVIILAIIGICLPAVLISEMGGPVATIKSLPPVDGNWLGGMTLIYLFSLFLIDIPIVLVDATLWQKTGAAKSVADIKKATFIAAILFILWGTLTSAMGVVAHVLEPDLLQSGRSADAAMPVLILNYMPPVLKGLGFAALIAVMISTASTAMLVAGTTVGFEVVRAIKPQASDKTVLLVTRLTIVFIAISGIAIAVNVRGVFDLLLLAMAIYVSGLFVPTMCAIFWKRATTWGALSASLGGAGSVLFFYALKTAGKLTAAIEPIVGSLIISCILMYVVSRLTYNELTATEPLSAPKHKKRNNP